MSLLPLFHWLQYTRIGVAIRDSTFLFPAIEVVHLLGLVLLLGPVLVVDLGMLGFGARGQLTSRVAKASEPLIRIGIVTMLFTGVPLLLSEALKCYESGAFWFKMYFFAGALLFHFTIYRRVTTADSQGIIVPKLTAILSLALWFGVAVGGRIIAFL